MDDKAFLSELAAMYGCEFSELTPLREWIGLVWSVRARGRRWVVKLARPENDTNAVTAAEVMDRIGAAGIRVPGIMKTVGGDSWARSSRGVVAVYEFIDGDNPDRDGRLQEFGALHAAIRAAMAGYGGALPKRDYDSFVGRYLRIMKRKGYRSADGFAMIGSRLWQSVESGGFGCCHGDFHCGNMFQSAAGPIVFDFDACGIMPAAYDMATMCDATGYFSLEPGNFTEGYAQTIENAELFAAGAGMRKADVAVVPALVGLRHFDIQASIIEALGDDCVSEAFLDRQLSWLRSWTAMVMR